MAISGGGRLWQLSRKTASWLLVSSCSLKTCSSQRISSSFIIYPINKQAGAVRFMSASSASTSPLPPPLIDVDCNLWHDDLQQPLLPSTMTSTKEENGIATESTTSLSLHILDEDAVMENNIIAMISPSSTVQDAKRGLGFMQTLYTRSLEDSGIDMKRYPLIRTTVGVHPYHVNDPDDTIPSDHDVTERIQSTIQQARELVQTYNNSDSEDGGNKNKKWIVAIGECGLDASPGFPPIADQLPWFEAQVELAQELQLPLFVHERLAHAETLQILDTMTRPVPVLIHCFTGTPDECHAYVQRGYSLSFSGFVLKAGPGNDATRECLQRRIPPLSKIMIETDAPYMGFPNGRQAWLQKQEAQVSALTSKLKKRLQTSLYPNVPSSLVQVLDQVVALLNHESGDGDAYEDKGMELSRWTREEVAYQTTRNAIDFFGLGIDVKTT